MSTLHLISSPHDTLLPQAKEAIVTLVIGDSFRYSWEGAAKASWVRYAEKHDLDIVLIQQPLDGSLMAQSRSPAWQKCLILSLPWSQLYQRIIWVDADIIINPHSPHICYGVPQQQVGAVINYDQMSLAEKHIRLDRTTASTKPDDLAPMQTLEEVAHNFKRFNNFLYRHLENMDTDESRTISTGVLVLSPQLQRHRELLEDTYHFPQRTKCYEQHPLSLLLMQRGLLYELNPRFNWHLFEYFAVHCPKLLAKTKEDTIPDNFPWSLFMELVENEFHNSYFLHFAALGYLFNYMRIQISSIDDGGPQYAL
ncbi:MAG: hypothetical protein HQL60_00280 [Magnetococcales bacterium]|nr:hypothetical protein [Magnetococcales bacterium]